MSHLSFAIICAVIGIFVTDGCEESYIYTRHYGNCTVRIETCRTKRYLTSRWNAFAQIVSSGEWTKTSDFEYEYEHVAFQHVVQALFQAIESCNCRTFDAQKKGCSFQIRSCENFNKNLDDVTNNHPQYKAWAISTNSTIYGDVFYDYNQSVVIQTVIQDVSTIHMCPFNISSIATSNDKRSPVIIIIVVCACVLICSVTLTYVCCKSKQDRHQQELQIQLLEPLLQFTTTTTTSYENVTTYDAGMADQCAIDSANDRLSKYLNKYVTAIHNDTLSQIDGDMNKHVIAQMVDDYHLLLTNPDGVDLPQCTIMDCTIFHKHFRDKSIIPMEKHSAYTSNAYAKGNLQILGKIHCFCQHSKDISCIHDDKKSDITTEFETRMNNKYINQLHIAQENERKILMLGWEFKYVGNNTINNMDGEKDNTRCVSVKAKYGSFKVELKEHNLLEEQYDAEHRKAIIHYNCAYRKKRYQTIQLEHAFALMIYCDFDYLQRVFSRTYRDNQGKNHTEFYHFGKLLKEAVRDHGTCIRDGRIQMFYHGMNQKLVPTQVVGDLGKGISIFCPISTSSTREVALNFGSEGLVMVFGGRTSTAQYFSVAWLSDYAYEREHLFIQNRNELHIKDIIECDTHTSFGHILNILKAMDSILCEVHLGEDDSSKHIMIKDIIKVMSRQLCINNGALKSEKVCGYEQDLLTVYFGNKDKLTINFSVLRKKYKPLFEVICFGQYEWIRIDKLELLFPRITNIEIKDIDLCSEIMEDISTNREIFDPNNKAWKLKRMTLKVKKTSPLNAAHAVRTYRQEFRNDAIKLVISQHDLANEDFDTIVIE
eukprot:492742_1